MLEEPEFEPEFYKNQIEKMEERYFKIFKEWNISWDKYYGYISEKLKNNQYWIWIYLCGFEKFIQENKVKNVDNLYKDANLRIYRIIGDHFKIKEYIRLL